MRQKCYSLFLFRSWFNTKGNSASYHPSNVYFMETFSGSVYRWDGKKGKRANAQLPCTSQHVPTNRQLRAAVIVLQQQQVGDQHTQTKATNQFFQKKKSFFLLDWSESSGCITRRVLECFKWFCLCRARWSRFLFKLDWRWRRKDFSLSHRYFVFFSEIYRFVDWLGSTTCDRVCVGFIVRRRRRRLHAHLILASPDLRFGSLLILLSFGSWHPFVSTRVISARVLAQLFWFHIRTTLGVL